jgi:hypothetical protein
MVRWKGRSGSGSLPLGGLRASRSRLGEMVGKIQTAVGHYKSGRALPPVDTLLRIAAVTGTTFAI